MTIDEFSKKVDMYDIGELELKDVAPGTPVEILESAGCTGGCPTYPGAPKTEDGYSDCSKCSERVLMGSEKMTSEKMTSEKMTSEKMPNCVDCSYGSSRTSKCKQLMAENKCPEKKNYKGER